MQNKGMNSFKIQWLVNLELIYLLEIDVFLKLREKHSFRVGYIYYKGPDTFFAK